MKNNESKSIGQRIREVRKRLGLTQPEFAELCGFGSPESVSQYEAGRRRPDPQIFINIHRAAGVDLNWLLADEVAKSYPEPSVTVRRVRELEARDPDAVRPILESVNRILESEDPKILAALRHNLAAFLQAIGGDEPPGLVEGSPARVRKIKKRLSGAPGRREGDG